MPITGPTSFVPTLNLFIPHWVDVNSALGTDLVLEDGTTITVMTGYRNDLDGFRASMKDKINDSQIAVGFVTNRKTALVSRLAEFNRKVRGSIGSSPYAAALPLVPSITSGEGLILDPLDDMASLWPKINAATIAGFTGPLVLPGGYALAAYLADLALLRTSYIDAGKATHEVDLELKLRNFIQDKAYDAMVKYREKATGEFTANDPHVLSLPAVKPPPGSTPDPVQLSGSWSASLLAAVFTWLESIDPNLAEYELRMNPGATYNADLAFVVGNAVPGTLTLSTLEGLIASGMTASFRLFVITTTGNEAGSNTITITRPV